MRWVLVVEVQNCCPGFAIVELVVEQRCCSDHAIAELVVAVASLSSEVRPIGLAEEVGATVEVQEVVGIAVVDLGSIDHMAADPIAAVEVADHNCCSLD